MVFDISKINELKDYIKKTEQNPKTHKVRDLYLTNERPFLVVNHNTIEVRCDEKLSQLLKEKYESVMDSRYFGRGGIEIVLANQLKNDEVLDLIRLSYDMTAKMATS